MKIQIRYYLPGWYDNFATHQIEFVRELNEISVADLKLKIQRKCRIEPKHQRLYLELENSEKDLNIDKKSLAFYGVEETTPIYLENSQIASIHPSPYQQPKEAEEEQEKEKETEVKQESRKSDRMK